MKKIFFSLSAALLVMGTVCNCAFSQETISVDASTFVAGVRTEVEADYSKPFTLEFKNNKKSMATTISLEDEDNASQLIRKGITTTADMASIKIPFTQSADRLSFIVKLANGTSASLSTAPMALQYNDNIVVINKKKQGPPRLTDDNNGSGNLPDRAVGIEIHDAILAAALFNKKSADLYTLLGALKGADLPEDEAAVKARWKDNPFISALLTEMGAAAAEDGGPNKIQGGLSSLLQKAGNLDVTNIADGLARFLVKRTKEELSIAFFQRFKDLINKPEYHDAAILFPETMKALNAIDQEIYQFDNYITTLREAFEKDLSLLLDHLPEVIEEGNFREYFSARPDLKYSLLTTLFIARELMNGTHPGRVIETFPGDYIDTLGRNDKNIIGAFKSVQVISYSLRSRGNSKYWTSLDSIQMLYRNDGNLTAARFYLGFIYEKSATVSFNKKTLKDYLDGIAASANDIKKYIAFIKQVGKKCHDVESAVSQVKNKPAESASIDVYNRLFSSFADVFDEILKVEQLPGISIDGGITASIRKYLAVYRQTNDIALNIVRKKYGSAIVNVYNIYLAATEKKPELGGEDIVINDNLKLSNEKVSTTNLSEGEKKLVGDKVAGRTSEFIRKYGNFMANVVKAESSEDVAAAIESVALPVGSATIKRHSNWNIALNAYVGLYIGAEKIKGVDPDFKPNTFGVTAPIGFSISKGINWKKKCGWSASLFISVIDLGAPVAFRFKDDKTEQVPTIQLKDIVSPGLFASIGFPRIPVSCNIGWQAGPVLRKIDAQYASTASSNYSRLSISFLVDIPLINFYTKRND